MTGKLKFIAGRAGSGKTEYCLSAIADRLQEAPLGPACILLLPEHMTYQMERQLAQRAGEGRGFLRAYVFGFRRFARQVLLDAGGLLRPSSKNMVIHFPFFDVLRHNEASARHFLMPSRSSRVMASRQKH